MDVWDKCDEVLQCGDLTKRGSIIIDFATDALRDKDKAKLVKRFYSQLVSFAFGNYVFDMSEKNI